MAMSNLETVQLITYMIFGLGFWSGIFEASCDGKCSYSRLIAFEPGHIVGCELAKKRWGKE